MPERPTVWWDTNVAQFRRANGTFISGADVRRLSEQSIEARYALVNSLGSRVHGGNIGLAQWQAAMREQIKSEYIGQYLAGRGGRDVMTSADWGSIGGMLSRTQYHPYLDRFVADIAAGKLTEAQIQWRSRLYIQSAKQAFEKAQWRAKTEAGYTWVKWTLTPAESCVDCIEFASLGWQRADTDPFGGCTPGSSCSVCLTNCKCFLAWATGEEPPG